MDRDPVARTGWRTQDIVVAAVIAVAFGVIFWAWNLLWGAAAPAFAAFPPAQAAIYGVWLVPAVLGMLVIQRPGASLFAELVAATVSALLGSQWGLDTLVSGFMQGAAAELVFAFGVYRFFGLAVAAVAAAAAGAAAWLHDILLYYPSWALEWQLVYGMLLIVSAIAIAGVGSVLLARALTESGVLASFPPGRRQTRI
jgi:energy-coupling factor transport system substrate-specific component